MHLTNKFQHARSCEAWLKEVKDIRELELNSIRNQRATQYVFCHFVNMLPIYYRIRKRLADLDYNPELKFLDDIDAGLCSTLPRPNICSLIDHPCVNSPEPLTERSGSHSHFTDGFMLTLMYGLKIGSASSPRWCVTWGK